MTYQELVKCYPWIDLVLELFKGVMPTFVALLAIFLNNSFAKKRELKYRKKSLQLDYYTKILNWLHDIKNDIMEVSRDLDNALNRINPNDRVNKYNNFMKSISNMNVRIASWKDTYGVILDIYSCNIKLSQLKKDLSDYSDNLVKIGNKYIKQENTSIATEEINNIVIKVNVAIDESIKFLLKEMSTLY